jgi:hypothetical protein
VSGRGTVWKIVVNEDVSGDCRGWYGVKCND